MLATLMPPIQSYDWMLNVLYGDAAMARSEHQPAVTWARHGELPSGYRLAEQFAVLPGGRDRAFLVSLGSRRGAASALTSYNALRPAVRRAARAAMGLALRSGAGAHFLRTRVDVGVLETLTEQRAQAALISGHLAELLRRPQVVLAFGGGSGPYRKPVLQVFGTDGVPLAYAKIGWNTWTREAVRREAEALMAYAAKPGGGRLGAPRLLHHGQWNGLELLLTEPLPKAVKPAACDRPPATFLREICELSAVSAAPLGDSTWWAQIMARIESSVPDPATRARLLAAAAALERANGTARLEFGRWHGDLVPWNLASLGSRLFAWDWETSAASAPVGMDAVHFGFQVAFVDQQVPLAGSVRTAAQAAGPALSALGVPHHSHGLLSALHLLELAVRHEEARGSTGDADERFYPEVFDVLDRVAAQSAAARLAGAEERAA